MSTAAAAKVSGSRKLYKRRSNAFSERLMQFFFGLAACISIMAVLLICLFLFVNGIPAIAEIGAAEFILGERWKPGDTPQSFGILPMIMGSIYITAGAVIIGVPLGLLTAVYLSRFCPKRLYAIIKPMINLMAGIPSIVYGFFGMIVLVPMIRELAGGSGNSILTASVLLGIMILPTVVGLSESSMNAVDKSCYEGALALGATHERAVFSVIIPAARSGIMSSVILGIGRAIGETMAVIMVAGNQARMPAGILKGVRTLTANIVTEMGYAADLHYDALIGTGVVLFVFILILNICFSLLNRQKG
ncbi:MAG: phosphate ABC transporter permease subunit PstC [Oscillospiraceae bacterium]|nr:phosphate ABC transporter permease subunit PstC [Oscillospiraceae bacterium]